MEKSNRDYSNDDITVYWRPDKCIHATYCYRDLVEVFNPRKRPWVNMKGASTEKIIEIINKCPTEALMYKWNDEKKNQSSVNLKNEKIKNTTGGSKTESAKPVKIQVMKDGPLVVQGSFRVIDGKGNQLSSMVMTSFCRCGATNNVPYCDGSHRKIDFKTD
jgi:uncharacterized Fe-S cluster protein YjdI